MRIVTNDALRPDDLEGTAVAEPRAVTESPESSTLPEVESLPVTRETQDSLWDDLRHVTQPTSMPPIPVFSPPRATRPTHLDGMVGTGSSAPGAKFFTMIHAVAVTVGLIFVFISHDFWFVPMLAMLGYALGGYQRAVKTGTVFEFGDSIYYLGFTLSVGSLLASLEPFKGSGMPDPSQIFHYFGLGMLTTLAGVVSRTLLQTFHRVGAETLEEVNRRVTDEAHRYVEQLSTMNRQMAETVERTTATYEHTLAPRLADLSRSLEAMTRDVTAAVDAAAALNARATEATQAFDTLTTGYVDSSTRVAAAQESIVAATAGFAQAVAGAASVAGDSTRPFAAELEALAERATAARAALDELERKMSAIDVDAAPLAASIASVGESLTQAAGAARTQTIALAESVESFARQTSQARDAGRQLADPSLAQGLGRLAQEVALLADATKTQRELTSTEAATLREQTQSALRSARDVSAALDEITRVALDRLKALDPTAPRGETRK